jgi:hypothetical protein
MTADGNLSVHSTLRGLTNPRKVLFGALCLALALALQVSAPGFTRLELTDAETGRKIVSAILRDGEPMTLTWHNSLFDLDVVEEFVTENGVLIQTAVTFADPRSVPPPLVAPEHVDDLYHTGGAFAARGLRRPFMRIVYRVGEIGNPRMTLGARSVEFKREVGFGGSIVLTTRAVNVADAVVSVFATISPWAR